MPVKNPRFQKVPSESKECGKEGHSTHQSHAADDIVFGSVDIETIRENVGRFNINKEKEESKKGNNYTDGVGFDPPAAAPLSTTSLPDVVQQHSEPHFQPSPSDDNNRESAGTPERTKLLPMEISSPTCDKMDILSKTPLCLGSSEMIQPDGMKNETGIESTETKDSSTVSSSLAQLQDPATFTLGSPEKKNRITKTNFGQEEGALLRRNTPDSSDPLASLDPLWSLGKWIATPIQFKKNEEEANVVYVQCCELLHPSLVFWYGILPLCRHLMPISVNSFFCVWVIA